MKIIKYPDGTSYAVVNEFEKEFLDDGTPINRRSKTWDHFTFKLNSYEDLWQLNQLVDAYNSVGSIPTITIPWLIDGQADRRFNKNESSGLKLLCKFLTKMEANFKIFHPHNAEVVEALIDNVEIIDNGEFIRRVIYNKIYDNKSANDLTVLLPDGGAFKWGAKLMDKLGFRGDVIAAAKNRKFVDGKSVLTQQLPDYDFEGKDILLLDDILIYGGSAKGLAAMLREKSIRKIYGAFSHLTVQNFPDSSLFDLFDRIYTTNSKFDSYFIPHKSGGGIQPENLTILSLF